MFCYFISSLRKDVTNLGFWIKKADRERKDSGEELWFFFEEYLSEIR